MSRHARVHIDNSGRTKTFESRALQPTNGQLLAHTNFEETLFNIPLDSNIAIDAAEPCSMRQPYKNDAMELIFENMNKENDVWIEFGKYLKTIGSLKIAPGGSGIIRFRFNGTNWIEAYRSSTL